MIRSFTDPPRADAKATIAEARDLGIAVKMITGDSYLIAKRMAALLDLGAVCRTADGLPALDEVHIDWRKMKCDFCIYFYCLFIRWSASFLIALSFQLKRKPENLARDYGDMVLGTDTFAQVYPEV